MLLFSSLIPLRVWRRDVKVSVGRHALERARRIHRRETVGAVVFRCLRNTQVLARGRRHDVIRANESAYAVKLCASVADKPLSRRMISPERAQSELYPAPRCNLFREQPHLFLCSPQLSFAFRDKLRDGCFNHLVVEKLTAIVLFTDSEVAVGARQEVAL